MRRILGSVLLLIACDQPPYLPPKEELDVQDTLSVDASADASDADTTPPIPPNCNIGPRLSDLQEKYFSKSCAFGGCHDAASQEGGLDLESSGLHARLVNVPAADDKAGPRGKLRVVPGAPTNSYFVQKLDGTMARDEGNMMPDGTDEPIDPACRIRMVRDWISAGALDN
jgi:hypothetical protein